MNIISKSVSYCINDVINIFFSDKYKKVAEIAIRFVAGQANICFCYHFL